MPNISQARFLNRTKKDRYRTEKKTKRKITPIFMEDKIPKRDEKSHPFITKFKIKMKAAINICLKHFTQIHDKVTLKVSVHVFKQAIECSMK